MPNACGRLAASIVLTAVLLPACADVWGFGDLQHADGGAGSDGGETTSDDASMGEDAIADAVSPVDGSGSSCNGTVENGTTLCTNVQTALCTRRVACCSSGGMCGTNDTVTACQCLGRGTSGSTCTQESTQSCTGNCGDTCSTADCSAWMPHDPIGHDCTQASFANASACSTTATTCTNDVAQIACSDFTGGTWGWPASCSAFWAQF